MKGRDKQPRGRQQQKGKNRKSKKNQRKAEIAEARKAEIRGDGWLKEVNAYLADLSKRME